MYVLASGALAEIIPKFMADSLKTVESLPHAVYAKMRFRAFKDFKAKSMVFYLINIHCVMFMSVYKNIQRGPPLRYIIVGHNLGDIYLALTFDFEVSLPWQVPHSGK